MGDSHSSAGYTEAERGISQRVMIMEGLFSRAMEGMTGGVVLAGFALALGATEFMIGLVASIPFLAQLAHVPAAALLNRYPHRRRLAVGCGLASRSLFFAIALIPFLSLPWHPLHVLVPLLVAYATIATFSGAAWQVWVREVVPRGNLGTYLGRRMAGMSAVALLVLLGTGQFLAWWQATHPLRAAEGFGLLFAVGGLLGYASSITLSRAPATVPAPKPPGEVLASLKRPLRERNYRRVLVFLASWGFAANFAAPFLAVVLLDTIGYGFDVVTGLAAVSILANILGFRAFAPLTDHFGNKPVLTVSASAFVLTMLAWALVPKVPGTLTLGTAVAVHVVLGFANAGINVSSNGVIMKLAPDDDAAAYLASASAVRALATGLAPLLAGIAATVLSGYAFNVAVGWTHPTGTEMVSVLHFAQHDFLFLASVLLGTYSLHRLVTFEEEGEAPKRVVFHAMRRELLHVSTVAGFRQFSHLGSYLAEAVRRGEPRRRGKEWRSSGRAPNPRARKRLGRPRVALAFWHMLWR